MFDKLNERLDHYNYMALLQRKPLVFVLFKVLSLNVFKEIRLSGYINFCHICHLIYNFIIIKYIK